MKGINIGKKNGNYSAGISMKLEKKLEKEPFCKICSTSFKLFIHHLDMDKTNNNWNNLIVLCSQCHNVLHQRGYNFRKGIWSIRITEEFTSIQGEGINCGSSCHFLRMFGCNLNCIYCDSDYSKNGEFKELNYLDIVNLCKKWKKSSKINRVVITGGEPLFQNIIPLLMILKIFNYEVEIETNGTLPIKDRDYTSLFEKIYRNDLVNIFNISPKLKKSQLYKGPNKGQKLINKNNINQFKQFNYILKFVVKDENDLKQVLIVQEKCDIPKNKIWLMPLTTKDEKENIKIQQKVWNYCTKHDIKYSPRIHVDVWGKDKRGV